MAYVVLALALVALLPIFILSIRANLNSRHLLTAVHLSQALVEEIRLRRWDQATPPSRAAIQQGSPIGIDAGENIADKRTFNDIDDFNGWNEAPPLGPLMQPLSADFAAYSRSVTVQYVTLSLAPTSGPTDHKMVTVCTSHPKFKPVCQQAILTNH